jgi:hypothetical protein
MGMTTWREIATGRGFTDLGNRTWTAPNGQTVAEGFVELPAETTHFPAGSFATFRAWV